MTAAPLLSSTEREARRDRGRIWREARRALGIADHEMPRVRRALGFKRTQRRYENEGRAPRSYLLALLGVAYVRKLGVEGLPPEVRSAMLDNPDESARTALRAMLP